MASNSGRKSGSSDRSKKRRRVVIGAEETVRVRYKQNTPEVESERRATRSRREPDAVRGRGNAPVGKRLSNSKREERELRQRAIRLRRFMFVVAVVAAVSLVYWGLVTLYRAPILPVKNVEVLGAAHHDRQRVLDIADIPPDATLLRLPARRIEASLTADPWIASAEVERSLPGTVRISLVERKPAAVVDAGGTNVIAVSEDGHWLGKRGEEDSKLIVINNLDEVAPRPGQKAREPEVTNALAVIAGLSADLLKQTVSVSAPSVDETALILRDDIEVFVGDAAQMSEKDRIIREILAQQEGVVYINVRVVDRPTWRGLTND